MDIYKATNNITEESYIGYATKGLEERKSEHKNSANREDGYYFQRAIKKYGWDNFRWIMLEQGVIDFEILKELEKYWIREFGTKRPNGYNLTEGGDGTYGYKHTEETKKKISKIHHDVSGKKNPMYGKNHTEEAKSKMKKNNPHISGEQHWCYGTQGIFYGRKHKEETKQKIGNANRGKIRTNEVREKYRMINLNRKHTEETKAKLRIAHSGANNGNAKNYKIVFPDGKTENVKCLKIFCYENELNYTSAKRHSYSNIPYKGYKIERAGKSSKA